MAAFVLTNQRGYPEMMTDYLWVYRADGSGKLSFDDRATAAGIVTNARHISFAGFSVPWSDNTDGKGFVYFSAFGTEMRKEPDFLMCVTAETNLSAIDAHDWRWKYRGRAPVNIRALVDSQLK